MSEDVTTLSVCHCFGRLSRVVTDSDGGPDNDAASLIGNCPAQLARVGGLRDGHSDEGQKQHGNEKEGSNHEGPL